MRTPFTAASRKRRKILSTPPDEGNHSPTLDSREGNVRASAGTKRKQPSSSGKERDEGSREDPDDSKKESSGDQRDFTGKSRDGREFEKEVIGSGKGEGKVEGYFETENRGGKTKDQIVRSKELFAKSKSVATKAFGEKIWCFEEGGFRRETSENGRRRKEEKRRFRLLALSCILFGLLFGHWWPGRAEALTGGQKYSTRVVKTRYGTLRGIEVRTSAVEVYLGVPYATPPLGSLRYMPPVTPTSWRGIKFADSMPPACPQKPPKMDSKLPKKRRLYLEKIIPILANQSEDCLYLNLYVPTPTHGESYS